MDITEYKAQHVVELGDQQRPSYLSRLISLIPTFLLITKINKTKTTQTSTRKH